MMAKMPAFIIIGAMKSATSTLYDQLVAQPDIYLCEPKEPNYFSDDDIYAKGIGWYKNLFSKFPDNGILGEASTHYTKLPTYTNTVERIHKHLDNVRFIYVMRHPIDRLISHYIHEWSMGNIKTDINKAINENPELINYSLYSMQLLPYIETFGKNNILPVFFDRLISNPQTELERICNFIGYNNKPQWYYDIKASNISNKRIKRFPFYNFIVESRASKYLRRRFVPKFIRAFIKGRLRMKKRPEINKSNMEILQKIFDKDLHVLGQWLGNDINCNNYKEITINKSLEWV